MRIVDRKTFLTLPEGTVFAKGMPYAFGGLTFKHESTGHNDWFELEPNCIEANDTGELFERFEKMLNGGESFPMVEAVVRDGLYDDDAIFLVFERDDLARLRDMIDKALAVAQ